MAPKPKPTFIYHITHIRNLEGILNEGCLWSDNERKAKGLNTIGIAYEVIKYRRAKRAVPTCRKGFLADYVPFYFGPRSPMLYAIHSGQIENYSDGQESILHLVSKVEIVAQAELPFTFTNGHAEMAVSEFYESVSDLTNVDFNLMESTYWNDVESDLNRKWRRQAEFLVYNRSPCQKLWKEVDSDFLFSANSLRF